MLLSLLGSLTRYVINLSLISTSFRRYPFKRYNGKSHLHVPLAKAKVASAANCLLQGPSTNPVNGLPTHPYATRQLGTSSPHLPKVTSNHPCQSRLPFPVTCLGLWFAWTEPNSTFSHASNALYGALLASERALNWRAHCQSPRHVFLSDAKQFVGRASRQRFVSPPIPFLNATHRLLFRQHLCRFRDPKSCLDTCF